MAKHGLGRGLDALINNNADAEPAPLPGDAVMNLRIAEIDPNRAQPRRDFDAEALSELAASIQSVGVIQPVIVRKTGARYQLISGERRWRAARMAGLSELPAIVRDWDEARRLEVALIENLQRDDLNPVEEALGVKSLMEQCGYTQEAAATRLGKSRPALANLLRLLALPTKVLDMLREGTLSAGHARALASLSDENAQVRLASLCAAQGWSVRQLERICKDASEKPTVKTRRPEKPPEFKHLETMARTVFGTRAQIDGDMEKGRLVVSYYSSDDLQRIWDVLEGISHD